MLIRLGYDIELGLPQPATIVAILNVHSSRVADLREADEIQSSPEIPQERYQDSFGNTCTRLLAPPGNLRLSGSTLIEGSGETDEVDWSAPQLTVDHLPTDTLQFLLSSRYCEVDRLSPDLHGNCSATRPPDGRGFRPFATGSTNTSRSVTASPGPLSRLLTYTQNARGLP